MPDDRETIQYLRLRSELLARRSKSAVAIATALAPIADEIPADDLAREIESLPAGTLLEQNREYSVYLAETVQIPLVLPEIGRLREITFRAAGEGSGNACDLDAFDAHYLHLLIWNRMKREIVGSYRSVMCRTCSGNSGAKACIRLPCFDFTRCFSAVLGRRSSWGALSSVRNIRSSLLPFCCCGKASARMFAGVRSTLRSSAR
jgi:hypothetical protein